LATFGGLGSACVHACWRARLALANFFKFLDKLFDRSSANDRFGASSLQRCEATARLLNQHASRVRYPDIGRYTPKIDKSA